MWQVGIDRLVALLKNSNYWCQTNCFRVVVCLNSSLEKVQLAFSEVSFLLLEINLLLKFDFLLKYEAYPIKWTSDTWCFAGLYLPCGRFPRLRWSTAAWCRWRNLKPVHVMRKILWKTESVMLGKIVTFWRVKIQIWVIHGILLVSECCGTLGTAVNEAYFALFSMGAHVTGMTPGCENSDFYISIDADFWVHLFYFTE